MISGGGGDVFWYQHFSNPKNYSDIKCVFTKQLVATKLQPRSSDCGFPFVSIQNGTKQEICDYKDRQCKQNKYIIQEMYDFLYFKENLRKI